MVGDTCLSRKKKSEVDTLTHMQKYKRTAFLPFPFCFTHLFLFFPYRQPTTMPATCELCGSWLPDHQVRSFYNANYLFHLCSPILFSLVQASCPRNGVHPSQWTCFADPLCQAVNIDNIIMTNDDEDDNDTISDPSTIVQRLDQDTLVLQLSCTDHWWAEHHCYITMMHYNTPLLFSTTSIHQQHTIHTSWSFPLDVP